jgi:cytochrome P450
VPTDQYAAPDHPFTPEAKPNPYPHYAHLRATAPVHPVPLPNGSRVWVITTHADVERALRHPQLVKAGPAMDQLPPELQALIKYEMLSSDPPDHTRLRSLVQQAFTPRLVEQQRASVQQIADDLLDQVESAGAMDLIDDYAYPLPLLVIGRLLGVPEEDHAQIRKWSNVAIANQLGAATDTAQWRLDVLAEFGDYIRELCRRKRAEPADDLVSGLVQAEEQGDVLGEDELLGMVFLLIVAGHETTVNLIGNGMLALLRHPDQLQKLIDDPALVPGAVEECLRYDGPVETSTFRYSAAEVTLPGGVIPPGEQVLVVLGSANRDDLRFADADQFDITRGDRGHLAFGKGIHYCLGAPLARMEGQIAISTLLRRMPDLRPAVPLDSLQWRSSLLIRGLKAFPVEFTPGTVGANAGR